MAVPALDVFQVIGDPSRRKMLMLLSEDSLSINSLAEHFDMSRPAVSKHVKILHNSGFISMTDSGRERYCTLKQDGFKELESWLAYFDEFWKSKLKNLEVLLNKRSPH
ncbi:winged helix-turn-helix transcriptional regulator [Mucilaginibacter sp. 14171R-50]|uniref:ArsR/SmtB family transcription factor n=1 Tax=Mucilaginibacter sp. 14171R-50 TaxID=2703789 RepID=UPI00138BCB2A|nr:metalloregulator ArsR/SmtB family transcription factor [Mucilaginibacter sp. 14171R-50]QHS55635.1 winged helix-turn-helix transcriptional regulator [Mucilaginibacter sp. 14171R-50]